MDRLLSLWVPGRPRTKGSMRPIINWATQTWHLEEEVKQSKPWRTQVANAAIREVAVKVGRKWRLKHGYPYDGVVVLHLDFVFAREAGDESAWPIARRYGDIDKLQRNVLDALTDARVYADDDQVLCVLAGKRFGDEPGVLIRAERAPLLAVQRDMAEGPRLAERMGDAA